MEALREESEQSVKSAFRIGLALLVAAAVATPSALAQDAGTEDEGDEAGEESDGRVETVVVTGSRIARQPSEISSNIIILDQDAIRATGELTVARVLQQLPQNLNATNPTYGSRLNGAENKTGAATVNLRGLGSESTLILIDGRRVGYSGILGGVTDISSIPLSMVERIEVLLDGASAVYGSDAVGGVVNIITRKDYAGVEVDLEYGRPHVGGFHETRGSVVGGRAWEGGRATFGYERYEDSGLDSSQRDSIIRSDRLLTTNQKNTAPGPQIRVWTWFYDESCNQNTAILWGLDGRLLTNDEYDALDADSQARATCHNDLTLPLGFRHTDDLQSIDTFGEQNWGEEAEVGTSLRPATVYDVVHVGVDHELTDGLVLHGDLRFGMREATFENGLNLRSGTLHAGSPFNPFGKRVSLTGLAVDQPPSTFESETDEVSVNLGAEGSFADWTWQVEYGTSRQQIDTTRLNVRDAAYGLGVNSDGVTDAVIRRAFGIDRAACEALKDELGGTRYSYSSFFGGQCSVYGAPPDPIDPFGDISPWIIPDVDAGSSNEQTRFEALVRGELFDAPGGPVRVAVGYDFQQDVLDSFSEFSTGFFLGSSSPTGSSRFDTSVSRDNNAFFVDGQIPLIADSDGTRRLALSFSGRHDSYSNVDVEYAQTATDTGGTLEASDPGSKFTWRLGAAWLLTDDIRLTAETKTAFVAPQLNQLLSKIQANDSACLWRYVPGGGGAIGQLCDNVIEYRGGNDKLEPETAETVGFALEVSPAALPGFFLKAGWSDVDFKDRIVLLSVPIVDLTDLPSTVTYDEGQDLYIVDRRWINSSSVERAGFDYEVRYDWSAGENEFSLKMIRSTTSTFDVVQDASTGTLHNLVRQRDDNGPEDTVLPPVPKSQSNWQFTWRNGGMYLGLDVQTASETTILRGAIASIDRLGNRYVTDPAINVDLVASYTFESDSFLSGSDITLTINNVTNDYATTTNYSLDDPEDVKAYLVNPFYEWTQGRAYRLSLHKSF